MKLKITLIAAVLFAGITSSYGSDEKFVKAMQKNIQAVYEAKSSDELQTAINAFDRIASAEASRWEPFYYSAFGNLMLCARESDAAKKDQFIDRAVAAIQKAAEIKPNDSEIIALQGFATMMRVSVDPASRGAQFAGSAMTSFQEAIAINPGNPRALTLLAQMQHGTAQFFNSPVTEACETVDKALLLFADDKADNPLAPRWGKAMAMGLKENCK
jgi:tetratricopeptide (TPR) repeat protein